jgi:hypothetical protein
VKFASESVSSFIFRIQRDLQFGSVKSAIDNLLRELLLCFQWENMTSPVFRDDLKYIALLYRDKKNNAPFTNVTLILEL